MSHHLNSSCKQCFHFETCDITKKQKRNELQLNIQNGVSFIGMSTIDCFISPEQHKKDNLKNLSCFGHYDGSEQCLFHCKVWNECENEEIKNNN